VVGSERLIFSAKECVSAVQGLPRSLILASIKRAYTRLSILVTNSNFGSILHRRVIGLSVGEDFVIVAWVISIQCQRVTDGQTDGQADNPTVANTALCIASYADAL